MPGRQQVDCALLNSFFKLYHSSFIYFYGFSLFFFPAQAHPVSSSAYPVCFYPSPPRGVFKRGVSPSFLIIPPPFPKEGDKGGGLYKSRGRLGWE